jgi:hypothetical protein
MPTMLVTHPCCMGFHCNILDGNSAIECKAKYGTDELLESVEASGSDKIENR